MGLCGSSIPDEIIPDPTGPSKFYFKKAGMMSSNYNIFQGDEDGGKWLLMRKKGKFGDKINLSIENFVKDEETGKFGMLAYCHFDTIDRQAYKQKDMETHDDSDASDYSDDDSDEETEQKCKWVFKTKSKFYADASKTQHLYTIQVKAKGKAKRKVEFHEYEDANGEKKARAEVSRKGKVKKFFYKLTAAAGAGAGGEESKTAEGAPEIPIVLHGSLNKGAHKLEWESPMFNADIEGRGSQKLTVQTKEGFNPSMAGLIAYVCCIEIAPEDVLSGAFRAISWPTVHGPHGAHA